MLTGVYRCTDVGNVGEHAISDLLDVPGCVVGLDPFIEVDVREHGGLGITPTPHGMLFWPIGMAGLSYSTNWGRGPKQRLSADC
ncbi:MAG: hypothetical protein F4Y49_12895 [Dehalococcoidia bacterium]|nr:hypothetical protein [Dehalococcoidia bacterium]